MSSGVRAAALCCAAVMASVSGGVVAGKTPAASAPATSPPVDPRPPGQQLYGRHCLSCHQSDGGGVPSLQPAIKGGTWVQGDARALALFVLTGGFDSASRKDSDVDNVMPAFRALADAELAEILTFIRARFGNGATPVSAEVVAAARASLPPES